MTSAPQATASIDLDKCVGSTMCILIAPENFELDDHGQSLARCDGPACSLVEAAEACPLMAIEVRDAASGEVLFP